MKKNLLIVILPILLVIIFGYLFLSGNDITEYEPVQIFSTNIENITGISVALNKTENSFELVKNGEEWFFSDNKSLKVLQSKAHSLSYDVSHIFAERTVNKKGLNLQQYGLDPAVSIVTVKLNDGTIKEFHIGNRLDNGREYYFKVNDSPEVYTLYIGKGQMFTSSRQDFIDKKLSYISREDIKKVTVYNAEGEKTVIEKEQVSDGIYLWNVTEPVKWNVLESQLESIIIYPLLSLQAKSFDESTEKSKNFDDEISAQIQIENADGTIVNYYFSNKNEDGTCYVKKDSYYPALIESKLCDISEFKTEKILNKRISSYRIDGWQKAIFSDEAKSIACYAVNDTQRKYFINDDEVSNEVYTRFVSSLTNLMCTDILTANNLTELNTHIEYIYEDGSSLKFDFYKYDDETYAVTCDGQTFLGVSPDMFNAWKNTLVSAL